MLSLVLLPALAAAGPARGAVPVAVPEVRDVEDAELRLAGWIEELEGADERAERLDFDRVTGLEELFEDLLLLEERAPDRAREIHVGLLELLGLLRGREEGARPGARTLWQRARILCEEGLDRRMTGAPRPGFADWLAAEVLASETLHPERVRVAAIDYLRGRHLPGTMIALLSAGRDPDPDVRRSAIEAVKGWAHPTVHAFFLERLRHEKARTVTVRNHFAESLEEEATGLTDELRAEAREWIAPRLVSASWRDATRAVKLSAMLEPQTAFPLLIESLDFWTRRAAEGRGSLRIRFELNEELRRRSGRTIGGDPALWRLWWSRVRAGRIAASGASYREGEEYTSARFFGLRPMSDRVWFVIDASGSMATPFGTDATISRYDEATSQLLRYLESAGEDTRFGITLFRGDAIRWRAELTRATRGGIDEAERWLESRHPDGATHLREGIHASLPFGKGGAIDVERCEIDTIVVLCDGETAGGPGWIRPWMETQNDLAQLVFHCVQVGGQEDGSLSLLAELSDGRFVQVGSR